VFKRPRLRPVLSQNFLWRLESGSFSSRKINRIEAYLHTITGGINGTALRRN
jgi:hypothetical protein